MSINRWSRFIISMLAVAALTLSACGYRFPGEKPAVPSGFENASVRIVGQGKSTDPLLARMLRERLETRLGVGQGAVSSDADAGALIRVEMEPVNKVLILEDRQGRAKQYQVIVQAQPTLVPGNDATPPVKYASVNGEASYFELRSVTASRTSQYQAEQEALDQLVDALVALIAAGDA
ncbi:MAG: hypothetical protein HQL53_14730 [Magnetococcales bacterium]|nr:hypothetical protein [Magnetococcales bacterium]